MKIELSKAEITSIVEQSPIFQDIIVSIAMGEREVFRDVPVEDKQILEKYIKDNFFPLHAKKIEAIKFVRQYGEENNIEFLKSLADAKNFVESLTTAN